MSSAPWLIVFIALIALFGCAPHGNSMVVSSGGAGFWLGLWHGMICPVTFVISLFNRSVNMYEVANNGGWYNLGFLLGAGAWGLFRGSRARDSNRRRRHE
jgi:hypothetical protein